MPRQCEHWLAMTRREKREETGGCGHPPLRIFKKWKGHLTFCAVEGIMMERKLSVEVRD